MPPNQIPSQFSKKYNLNNPAGRLLNLLSQKEKPSFAKLQAGDVWCSILGVPIKDIPTLLRRVGKIMALPSLIEEQIKEAGLDCSIYLKWLPKVNRAFECLDLDMMWADFIGPIDETVMYGLEICSDQLSKRQPELVIRKSEIEKIKGEIDELLSEIKTSDIDKELKEYLTNHIEDIKNAIEEYELAGIVPIRKAFESTIGAIAVEPKKFQTIKGTILNKKIWTFLRNVGVILHITFTGIQLGNMIIPQLPGPETNIEESLQEETEQIKEIKVMEI